MRAGYRRKGESTIHVFNKYGSKVGIKKTVAEAQDLINQSIRKHQDPLTVVRNQPKQYKEEFGILDTHQGFQVSEGFPEKELLSMVLGLISKGYRAQMADVEMNSGELNRYLLYKK